MNTNLKKLRKFEEMLETQVLDDDCSVAVDFFSLVDALVSDIKHLEDEVIMLRRDYAMSLPEPEQKALLSSIFSDLSNCYDDSELFTAYYRCFHNGVNPLDCKARTERMTKISKGLLDSR
jgi:hypothetical protein